VPPGHPTHGPVYSALVPFPKRLLNSYETIKVDMHPHWWYLTPSVAALAVSVGFSVWALTLGDSNADKALKVVGIVLLVASGLWALIRYMLWVTTHFVVTSDRVIFRQGVLRKVGVQIPLERVNNVNFEQTIFERLLGAGDLLIESGGADGQQTFEDIRHPDRVTNIIHEAIEENTVSAARPGVADTGLDVAGQLERLEGLAQRGSITWEEFEAQKRRLLG